MALEIHYVVDGYWPADYAQTGITIDWANSIIHVPRDILTLIQSSPTEIRQLNLDEFRLELKRLENTSEGMAWPKTHNHNTTINVGGVILARVIEILEPYTVTFEDGQYAVNLVGANSNVADRVNVNQVSVRSSNSAGLQDLSTLLAAAYQGEVVVDPLHGQPGSSVPVGTRFTPVNNLADAIVISEKLGIRRIRITHNLTLTGHDFSDGYTFVGDNATVTSVTINPEANITNCKFTDMTLTGTLDGNNMVERCSVTSLTYTTGYVFNCAISGTIAIAPGSKALIMDCWSNLLSGSTAIIDLSGSGNVELSNFSGEVTLINYSGATEPLEVFMNAGKVILDPTLTGGVVDIYGSAVIVDNSNGTVIENHTNTNYMQEIHQRFDLDATRPNTYHKNPTTGELTQVTSADVTLTVTDNGNNTITVQRS